MIMAARINTVFICGPLLFSSANCLLDFMILADTFTSVKNYFVAVRYDSESLHSYHISVTGIRCGALRILVDQQRKVNYSSGMNRSEIEFKAVMERVTRERIFGPARVQSNGCWLFGRAIKRGYAHVKIKHTLLPAPRKFRAHRVAWIVHYGVAIPGGALVCHSCDVRNCINPAHLSLGTPASNMADKMRRWRHVDCNGVSIADKATKLW